jgi:hypothetical protein
MNPSSRCPELIELEFKGKVFWFPKVLDGRFVVG